MNTIHLLKDAERLEDGTIIGKRVKLVQDGDGQIEIFDENDSLIAFCGSLANALHMIGHKGAFDGVELTREADLVSSWR